MSRRAPQQIADSLARLPPGRAFSSSPRWLRNAKATHAALLSRRAQDGFTRARVDGELVELDEGEKLPKLDKSKQHTLELMVDRLVVPAADAARGTPATMPRA